MRDAADRFRARLAAELRAAFAKRDQATIQTLRCTMAVLDNAGAVAQDAQASYAAAAITEAPRRAISDEEIAALLQAEIAARNKTITLPNLRAEQRCKVPPLDLASAVDLFFQRAAAMDGGFRRTPILSHQTFMLVV